jgi:asparagine synthase (glutamine-hydrolysing)
MYDGRDRALARDAFVDDLPPQIRQRQSKGGLQEHAYDWLHHNMDVVRELLLHGTLVDADILDRSALENALASEPTRHATRITELYEYVNIEAWLRSFRSSQKNKVHDRAAGAVS